MTAPEPAPAAAPAPAAVSTPYDLHFLPDGKTFFWRNKNRGVTLIDDGANSAIGWQTERGAVRRLWTDIMSVTMMAGTDGKNEVNHCHIQFNDGRKLTLTDAGAAGTVDHSLTPIYRDFIRALHARLARAPEGTIRFVAGASEGRYRVMQVAGVIAALFFVGLPLVLLFIVREWKVLGVLAAGAAFVWPFWKLLDKNKPRSYDPRHPPGELME